MTRDLLTLVRTAAARVPSKGALASAPLVRVGDATATAAELGERVHTLAGGLRAAGMRAGDRVAVLLPRSLDEIVALLAVAAAGGIVVPIHGRWKDTQVAHVLADSEPFAVVTSAVRLLALAEPAALLAKRRTFVVGGDVGTGGERGGGAARPPVAHGEPLPVARGVDLAPPDPRSPAVLLYTSGSTGAAKGIVQDHHNLTLGAELVAGYLALGPADHVLALLPFSFDYGLNQVLSALHVGCRLTAAEHLGVGELAWLLRTHRPTGLAGVPSLWHDVAAGLSSGSLTAADGASLRYVTNSGGTLRAADSRVLRNVWPHVQVFAMYGLTEAFRSAFLPPAEFDANPESFGRALPGVELLLVDPGTGAVLDGEATGELVHVGVLVAHGYWRNPAATAQRFRPDPRGTGRPAVWSGDLVRRDAAGRHVFVARLDRLLKVQGHRISPDEVAAALAGADGAGEVAVLGCDGGADGHRIVAAVAGDPTDGTIVERLLRRCRARLPSYMVPSRLYVLRALPHNSNGKIDEGALRAHIDACTDGR